MKQQPEVAGEDYQKYKKISQYEACQAIIDTIMEETIVKICEALNWDHGLDFNVADIKFMIKKSLT